MNSSREHVWVAGTQAPSATVANKNCQSNAGSLCEAVCITVSQTCGSIGYAWKSFSTGVEGCLMNQTGQLYQFANVPMQLDDPIKRLNYVHSPCGYTNIHSPDGNILCITTGINAAKLTVDLWSNVYTLNYEFLKLPMEAFLP